MKHAEVSLARIGGAGDNDENELRRAVEEVLRPLGGLENFIARGDTVLLKPNQTLFKNSLSGSTTSPRLIRTLIAACFDAGAREVWVAEASGHAQMSRQVMAKTGMVEAVAGTGAHLIYLDEIAERVFDFGKGAGELRHMPAPEIMERADVIINIPKAKTHFVDPVSCACKNWVGVIPMSFRLYLQRLGDPYYRGNALFLKKFRPTLNIVDGAIAGEGQGPGQNDPFWWGWLLASTDPVAVDITVARLFGLEWDRIRMARAAADAGVGVYDPERIAIRGASFEDAMVKVRPADPSVHRYPCRVLEGKGATIEGTLGHWKTIADAWLGNDLWKLFTSRGTPTFMFGAVEDPEFERYVEEGPYVVLDDSALDRYKYDPRVVFIPGSPVPQSYMQNDMIERMGFGPIYEPGLRLFENVSGLIGRLRGVSGREAQWKAIATVGAGVAAIGGAIALIRKSGSTS